MYHHRSIPNLLEEERPREKLLARGASALTDAELLALVLGSGTAELTAIDLSRLLLEQFGGLRGLASCDASDLQQIHGVGPAKALSVVAVFELGRRRQGQEHQAPVFGTTDRLAEYLRAGLQDTKVEVFKVLYLDNQYRLLAEKEIGRGGISGVVADPRVIFHEAVRILATQIILCHNHPSGNAFASKKDHDLTEKMVAAGALLDITVYDHIIVTEKEYISFRDRGMMPLARAY
jgi:DNA repair protein RadC